MADIPAIALLFGLLGTTSLHLAKAFQRQGIDALRLRTDVEKRGKKGTIWIIGFVLNNIVTVFGILGAMFAPPSIYNSVFGLGLIVLLIYAHYILKEVISRREMLGAALIIAGTLGIGIISVFYTETPVILDSNFFTSFWVIFPLFAVLIIIGYKFRSLTLILFASTGGMLGAVGNVFLYVGNLDGGFAPDPATYIPVYIGGLLLGGVGFLLSQIAFYRGSDASQYVPIYNGLFFITPFAYEIFIFQVTSSTSFWFLVKLPFLVLILFGIYFIIGILVKTLKKPESAETPEESL